VKITSKREDETHTGAGCQPGHLFRRFQAQGEAHLAYPILILSYLSISDS
jgi:hypothetical protein